MNAPVSSKDHVVTYRGSTKSGHTWSCSCGSGSGDVAWADAFDRTMEAHAHLREFLLQPVSCMGCCYTENKAAGA